MPTLTGPQPMVARGPLTTPGGDLLWQVRESPAPAPRRTITVRCLDRHGRDLAQPVALTGPIGRDALAQIVGDGADGSMDAAWFGRRAFEAQRDREEVRATLRERVLRRDLAALDRLALAAVTRDIPATVTWTTNPNGA